MHSQNQKQSNWKVLKSFISGGTAGVISKTIIAPVQRVKYMYITTSKKFTYSRFLNDFAYIIRKNGFFNLWRGNSMNILRIFPHAAIDFAVFDFLRTKYYKSNGTIQQKIVLFFCGAAAGISALSATTPIQFIRVRLAMELDNFTYKDNFQAFKKVHQKEGLIGFYRGYGAAICGITIYHGFSFFIFTRLKQKVRIISPQSYSKWYVDFLIGGLSSIGQIVSYPFQILRRRMQGQNLLLQKKQIAIRQNYHELIKQILSKQGFFKGFYKGISLNFIKAPLSLATVWTVKNYINRKLDSNYDL